jgi:large subunit ribosomal protein L29
MLKMKDLKLQSVVELEKLAVEVSKDVFELRNEKMITRKNEKPHVLREKKRDRARILTMIVQQQKESN